jgi:hypothetical protein
MPITVAARSKALTAFARSNAGIVGSYPTRGKDVCVYSVFVLGTDLATGGSLVHGVLPTVYKIKKLNWNEAFHGYPMLPSGSNRTKPTKPTK